VKESVALAIPVKQLACVCMC